MTATLEGAEHPVAMGGAAEHHSCDSSIQRGRPLLVCPHQFHPVRSATYCLTCRAGLGDKISKSPRCSKLPHRNAKCQAPAAAQGHVHIMGREELLLFFVLAPCRSVVTGTLAPRRVSDAFEGRNLLWMYKIYTCWVTTLRSGPEDKKRSSLLLEFMGSYLAELSLLDYSCLRFLPSVVAASSIFIARLTNGPDTNLWGKEMHKLTGYRASELKDCIIAIHDLQLNRKGPLLPAIRDKYKQHRFKCVSMLLPPVEIPTSYFQDFNSSSS